MVLTPGDLPDWTRAYFLIGQDSDGNQVPILVDADGKMICLLQGQFGGVKTTISVDADGRLEAFVLDDESQWGDVIKVGNADLAGRLGSPITWDWRGKILQWSTFENGLAGEEYNSYGTGASVEITPDYSVCGGFSLLLQGGSTGTLNAYVMVYTGSQASHVVGFAVRVSFAATPDLFTLKIADRYGGFVYDARIQLDFDNDKLQYLDSDTDWQDVDDLAVQCGERVFHWIKLVVDMPNAEYVRCLVDDTEWDLSGIAIDKDASGSPTQMYCEARVYSHSGDNDQAYIDSYIITVGEPT